MCCYDNTLVESLLRKLNFEHVCLRVDIVARVAELSFS